MRSDYFKKILTIFLSFFLFTQLFFGNIVNAQISDSSGIIWCIPYNPDAFPVNGNRTANAGLNIVFNDYHVVEYAFLDSLYMCDYIGELPIYQIRIQEGYEHLQYELMNILENCFPGFFLQFSLPYHNEFYDSSSTPSYTNGRIYLSFYDFYFDPTLVPSSVIRSNNKPMNLILRKYDIKSYDYKPYLHPLTGDTLWRTIKITCNYQDALPLYYDLLKIKYLYEEIAVACFWLFFDKENPCGTYSGIVSENESTFHLYPNPATDEIIISGCEPESIILFDLLGKVVTTDIDFQSNKVNISKLPDGIYLLKVISKDGKVYTNKICKLVN